jgi:hypothetical protein
MYTFLTLRLKQLSIRTGKKAFTKETRFKVPEQAEMGKRNGEHKASPPKITAIKSFFFLKSKSALKPLKY